LEGAANDLEQARRLAPERADVWLATAEYAAENQDWPSALAACEQMARLGIESPVAYQVWGDALVAEGQVEEAVASWQQGLSLGGRHQLTLLARLAAAEIALEKLADADSVLVALENHVSRPPEYLSSGDRLHLQSTTWLLRAKWHLARREWSAATPLLRQVALASAIDVHGDAQRRRASESLLILAARETSLERHDMAAEYLERALANEPRNVSLRVSLAQTYAAAGQLPSALKHAEAATQRDAHHADAQLLLAQLRFASQARLPAADRDLTACEQAVNAAQALLPHDFRVALLQNSLPFLSPTRWLSRWKWAGTSNRYAKLARLG
jgi:tetratricopeptide (TPR) repeat protein